MHRTYDPKDGFTRVKGTAILDKNNPIMKTAPEAFNKDIEAIAGTLTPQQQQIFRARAARVSTSFNSSLYQYVASQTEKAYDESDTAKLKQAVNVVAVDPAMITSKAGEIREVLSNSFTRNGVTDKALQSVATTEALMPMVNAALKAYTTGDNPNIEAARQVMKDFDDIIPKAAKVGLEDHLKEVARGKDAIEIAGSLFDAYKTDAMKVTQVEAALNQYGKDDPKLREAARHTFYQNLAGLKAEREETLGGFIGQLQSAKPRDQQRLLIDIKGSDEFKALGAEAQGKLVNHAKDMLWQNQMRAEHNADHAQALIDRAERKKMDKPDVWDAYSNLYTDPNLASMSDKTLMAKEPEIGQTYVKELLMRKKQLVSGANKFDFDKAQLDPVVATLGKEEKSFATQAIYRNLTAWKERNPGREPTPPEQDLIIKNALVTIPTKRTLLGMEWTIPGRPAYKRGTEEGEKLTTLYRGSEAPIPVSKEFYDEAMAYNPRYTQQQLAKLWPVWKAQKDAEDKRKGNK